jgi:hypothetical protein
MGYMVPKFGTGVLYNFFETCSHYRGASECYKKWQRGDRTHDLIGQSAADIPLRQCEHIKTFVKHPYLVDHDGMLVAMHLTL